MAMPQQQPAPTPSKKQPFWKRSLSFGFVSKKDVLFFTKNLAIMLRAGSTLPDALRVLEEQSKGTLKESIEAIASTVEQGNTLSSGLQGYPRIFPPLYINMVDIGERSGNLEQNLTRLGDQLEKDTELRKKVIGAMIYPSVVLVGGLGLSYGIIIFILPKITHLFRSFKIDLPITTQLLMAIADFFERFGIWGVLASIFCIVAFVWVLKRPLLRPGTHWIILHIPIVRKIALHFNLALFCMTLSTLLESGIPIDEGIHICTKGASNIYYKRFFEQLHREVKAGGTLTTTLKTRRDLFPGTDVQIIRVGEESGTLTSSLAYCASVHNSEVDNITKNLATTLEPVLLIGIGLLVGFLALSIITPLYSITSAFKAT